MTDIPTHAMLLAAGLGTRMRPLSNEIPKPMLPLGGRPLVDHAIDRLAEAGVRELVVNTHYRAELLESHLTDRAVPPRIVFSREDALLETGGAVRAALPLLGEAPFFVVNGDAVWLDGPTPTLGRMAHAWGEDIDVLLLLHRSHQIIAETGLGDFALDPWGVPRRPEELEIVPYIYAGVQILRPAFLAGFTPGRFSMNRVWDAALAAGRLRAIVHDGLWFHLSTPADLNEAEFALHAAVVGTTT
ncbi:MAG: nucleotidyltransferase family protein [Acetobacteraceae bacterium]|nr:nucleotidyltransferase family protein [Acetobacteraceae bacterium]